MGNKIGRPKKPGPKAKPTSIRQKKIQKSRSKGKQEELKERKRAQGYDPDTKISILRGRPPILTEELTIEIAQYFRIGNYAKDVCSLVGVSPMAFYNWVRKGMEDIDNNRLHTLYATFVYTIKKAEAQAVNDSLIAVKMGLKNWQADMTFLERRHRNQWGAFSRTQIDALSDLLLSHSGKEQSSIDISLLSVEEMKQFKALMEKAQVKEIEGEVQPG